MKLNWLKKSPVKATLAMALAGLAALPGRATTFVTPDGTGDGSSWANAASLSAALANGKADEIWMKAGTYPVSAELALNAARTLRGGFAGTESTAGTRTGISTLEATDALTGEKTLLTINAASGSLTVENLGFAKSPLRGFAFFGGATLTLKNCVFEHNGSDTFGRGRGALLEGTGANTVTVEGCTFADNASRLTNEELFDSRFRNVPAHFYAEQDDKTLAQSERKTAEQNLKYDMRGIALYVTQARLVLKDTLFRANGVARTTQISEASAEMIKAVAGLCDRQSILCVEDANVQALNVRFERNVITGNGIYGGRVVFVGGTNNVAGSSFENCTWTSNDIQMDLGPTFVEADSGQSMVPRSPRLSCCQNTGALVAELSAESETLTVKDCIFAYNLSSLGWTTGVNVMKGTVKISGSTFWGNMFNPTWGQHADLFVGLDGRAELASSVFGGFDSRYLPVDDPHVTIGADMKYGDPCFATTPATIVRDYVTADPTYNVLTADNFPFIRPTLAKLPRPKSDNGRGNELQVWFANGISPNERHQENQPLYAVAPEAEPNLTTATDKGLYKANPTAKLAVESVDVTFPLDYKPKFVVKTGSGDYAKVTVAYSTTQPANANDPASYANVFARGQGTFGPGAEIVWNGDAATTKGGKVWWLVKTENAVGVVTSSGSTALPADAPEPTVWSTKTINLEPEPVMAYQAAMMSTGTHRYHYHMLAYDQWLGSQPIKVGFDSNGCRTGRVAEWFKHKAKRSETDSSRDEWGRLYDVGTPNERINRGIADDWFALMRPQDGDQEGRPLVVILHGRGSGWVGFFGVSVLMCSEGCYQVPDEAYGIALDCRENAMNDFWWGGMPPAATSTGMHGTGDMTAYYYNFMFGGFIFGPLNAGPTFDPFTRTDNGKVFSVHDWNDLAWCHQVGYPGNTMGLKSVWNYAPPDDTPTMKRVLDTIEWAVRKYKIDRNRIYLAGNSMGGQGTLAIGLKHGEVFAAINGNVPATVVYPASQMGFIDLEGKDVPFEQFQRPEYDPPVCVDISGSNDAWSRDHDIMYRNMNRFRYSYTGYWQPLGHNAGYPETRAVNPHSMRFDYFSVVKNRAYPVFSNADGNSRLPWPQQSWVSADAAGGTVGPDGVESAAGELEAAQNADLIGQWNSYFRWETVSDTADTLQFRLWIANEKEIPDGGPYVRPQSLAVDVSPRRLQNFPKELSGQGWWEMGGQSGNIEWDDITGCYTAERVTVTRTPTLLTFHASGRATAPTVTAALAGDPTGSSASYKVNVSAVGSGASSVKLTAKYGTDPQNLDKSTTLATSVAAGEQTYTISGLAGMRTKYYVRIFAENNAGKSTTVDCGSFETACAHANRGPIATAKAATCTEEGVSAGEKCLDCGFVFTRSKTTAALGHDFKFDHWERMVTDTEAGLQILKCTRCPETEEKEIKAGTSAGGEVSGNQVTPVVLAAMSWTGNKVVAKVPDSKGYTVLENNGGIDCGEYEVKLQLNEGFVWSDGVTDNPRTFTFSIVPKANKWTTEPSISRAAWNEGVTKREGVVTAGVPLFGEETMTVTLVTSDGTRTPFVVGESEMPKAQGHYKIEFVVPEPANKNYGGLKKDVEFTIDPPPSEGTPNKWFRLTITKKLGSNSTDTICQLGKLYLYSKDDEVQNLNLTLGGSAATLGEGQCYATVGKGSISKPVGNLFGTGTTTKLQINGCGPLGDGDSDYQIVITMHLKADTKNVSKYNLYSADDTGANQGRAPTAWTFEMSETGADGSWVLVDEQFEATSQYNAGSHKWYRDGGSGSGSGIPVPETFYEFVVDTCNHQWSETSFTAPTCTENGERVSTCELCKKTKTETLPKRGHAFDYEHFEWDPEVTETTDGYKVFSCTNVNGGVACTATERQLVKALNADKEVAAPTIASAVWNGQTQVASVPANDGYTVKANAGGSDVGTYDVVLALNAGYVWSDGDKNDKTLSFEITQAENSWETAPAISKASWKEGGEAGTLTPGVPKYEADKMTVTLDGADFSGTLPTAVGRHTLVYAVPGNDNVKGLSATVAFTIQSESAAGSDAKWFRLTLTKKLNATDGGWQLSEIGLFDADGVRQNLGLTYGSSATGLTAGQYFAAFGMDGTRLFDATQSSKVYQTGCADLGGGKESAYQVIVMRLKDDATPVVKYNFYSANDTYQQTSRAPTAWILEMSEDGQEWTTVDEQVEATSGYTTAQYTWYKEGGKDIAAPTAFYEFSDSPTPVKPEIDPSWLYPKTAEDAVYFDGGTDTEYEFSLDGLDTTEDAYVRVTYSAKASNYVRLQGLFTDKGGTYDQVYPSAEFEDYDRVFFVDAGATNASLEFQSMIVATNFVVRPATATEATAYADRVWADVNSGDILKTVLADYPIPTNAAVANLAKFQAALTNGTPFKVHFLGDSITQDTFYSLLPLLIRNEFPQAKLTFTRATKGSTGCWGFYENYDEWVGQYDPDLLVICGLDNFRSATEGVCKTGLDSVIAQAQAKGCEVLYVTPGHSFDSRNPAKGELSTLSPDPYWNDPFGPPWGEACASGKFVANASDPWTAGCYNPNARDPILAKYGVPCWDIYPQVYDFVTRSGRPWGWFNRDLLHNNERGKAVIARVMMEYFKALVEPGQEPPEPVQAENLWVTPPAISKESWKTGEEAGTVTPGVAQYGADTMTVTLDGAAWDGATLPTSVGEHKIVYTVPETDEWTGLSATLAFTISSSSSGSSGTTDKYFRLTITKKRGTASEIMQFCEFGLYSSDGTRRNSGLQTVTKLEDLAVGKCYVEFVKNGSVGKPLANLFDGVFQPSHFQVTGVADLGNGDADSQVVIYMHLADGDYSVSKYNLASTYEANTLDRYPTAWKLESRADASGDWTERDTQTEATTVAPNTPSTWYNDGGKDSAPSTFYEFETQTPEPPAEELPKVEGLADDAIKTGDALLAIATSASKITVPAGWTVDGNALKNAKGETFATFAEYYDVMLVENEVKLALNEKALPVLAESSDLEDAKSIFTVSDVDVGLSVKAIDPHLWYGLAHAEKLGDDFEPPAASALVHGEVGKVLELKGAKDGDCGYYRIYVTDVAPKVD